MSREKSKQGLAELYEEEFKNFLGLGENKQDRLKGEIMAAFKQVNYYLDSLSNFHFTPRVVTANAEASITEDKVPLSMFGAAGNLSKGKVESRF